MSDSAKALLKVMTYEEFLATPHENQHVEWVDGDIIELTPISEKHDELSNFLVFLLRGFVRRKKLGRVRTEPFQMKTGPDLPGRSPDIMFVSNINIERIKRTYLEGPADLVIEIVSPESGSRDRGPKFDEYETGGVKEYWLIDPQRSTASFYELGSDELFHEIPLKDGIFHSRVLAGLWLQIEWLFQEPLPDELNILRDWGIQN